VFDKTFIFLLTFMSVLFIYAHAPCEDAAQEDPVRIAAELNSLIKTAGNDFQNKTDIENRITALTKIAEKADLCIQQQQAEQEKIQSSIDLLGQETQDEKRDVSEARKKILKEKGLSESKSAQCKLIAINAAKKTEELNALKQKMARSSLLHREDDILTVFSNIKAILPEYRLMFQYLLFSTQVSDSDVTANLLFSFFSFSFFVFLVVFFILSKLKQSNLLVRFQSILYESDIKKKAIHLVSRYLAALSGLAVFIGLYVVWTHTYNHDFFLFNLACFSAIYMAVRLSIAGLTLISSFYVEDNNHFLSDIGLSRTLDFAGIVFVVYLSFNNVIYLTINPHLFSFTIYILIDALCIISVWWFFYISRRCPKNLKYFVYALQFVLILIALTASAGYLNLAGFVLRSMWFSLAFFYAVLVVDILLRGILNIFAESVNKDSSHLTVKTRNISLLWFRIGLDLFCFIAFVLGIVRIWSVTGTSYSAVHGFLMDGFSVGSFSISPAKLVFGLIVFVIFWNLSGILKKFLKRRWADEMYIEVSALDALTTLTGYAGFIVAMILGLSVAGFNFSNLAMIAGALSVGIGFGLQNIVNNFVSGLILLFERPIKKGDWVVVKDVEGIVKRISVRSTIVQTFDHQDIIVPNSEFVSGIVKNWALDDISGRVRINVGVAYGSDVELVKAVLIDVVSKHPMVITSDPSLPPPTAWIINFGDSSVDFQVWFYVRDINRRPAIASDIRFAIYKTFRENGIEIPFPQRDVHIKKEIS